MCVSYLGGETLLLLLASALLALAAARVFLLYVGTGGAGTRRRADALTKNSLVKPTCFYCSWLLLQLPFLLKRAGQCQNTGTCKAVECLLPAVINSEIHSHNCTTVTEATAYWGCSQKQLIFETLLIFALPF